MFLYLEVSDLLVLCLDDSEELLLVKVVQVHRVQHYYIIICNDNLKQVIDRSMEV